MYCIRCGVKLADTEKVCPLCETTVYHPEIELKEGEPLYPRNRLPNTRKKTHIPEFIITFMVMLSGFIVLLCDLQIFNAVTWSGYVVGGLILGYVSLVLPLWFKRPNPVIFVPIDFVVLGAYLLYIDLYTGGGWFFLGWCQFISEVSRPLVGSGMALKVGKLFHLASLYIDEHE